MRAPSKATCPGAAPIATSEPLQAFNDPGNEVMRSSALGGVIVRAQYLAIGATPVGTAAQLVSLIQPVEPMGPMAIVEC